MRAVILILLLIIISVFAGFNISFLWDGSGVGQLACLVFSIICLIAIVPTLLIRSGIQWILFSKVFALLTMLAPLALEEYWRTFNWTKAVFSMNMMLIPICVISIIAIYKNEHTQSVTK